MTDDTYSMALLFIIFMFCYVWWLCMAININVHYNGGLLSDIILLTQGYYPRATRLHIM